MRQPTAAAAGATSTSTATASAAGTGTSGAGNLFKTYDDEPECNPAVELQTDTTADTANTAPACFGSNIGIDFGDTQSEDDTVDQYNDHGIDVGEDPEPASESDDNHDGLGQESDKQSNITSDSDSDSGHSDSTAGIRGLGALHHARQVQQDDDQIERDRALALSLERGSLGEEYVPGYSKKSIGKRKRSEFVDDEAEEDSDESDESAGDDSDYA